jgi:hypothetical protein
MKRIYIAGAIQGKDIIETLDNIRIAIELEAELILNGYAVFCPHRDFQVFLSAGKHQITKEMIQANSMAWLEVSDEVILTDNQRNINSEGTRKEIERARSLNIRVWSSTFLLSKIKVRYE